MYALPNYTWFYNPKPTPKSVSSMIEKIRSPEISSESDLKIKIIHGSPSRKESNDSTCESNHSDCPKEFKDVYSSPKPQI